MPGTAVWKVVWKVLFFATCLGSPSVQAQESCANAYYYDCPDGGAPCTQNQDCWAYSGTDKACRNGQCAYQGYPGSKCMTSHVVKCGCTRDRPLKCGGVCTDIFNTNGNCGSCGKYCGAGEKVSSGRQTKYAISFLIRFAVCLWVVLQAPGPLRKRRLRLLLFLFRRNLLLYGRLHLCEWRRQELLQTESLRQCQLRRLLKLLGRNLHLQHRLLVVLWRRQELQTHRPVPGRGLRRLFELFWWQVYL